MDVAKILEDVGFDPIQRKHRNLWVRCPNPDHEDVHPSCSINAETGLWKCWSCDESEGMQGNLPYLIRIKTGCSWKRAAKIVQGEASIYDSIENLKGKLVYDESTAKKRKDESVPVVVDYPYEYCNIIEGEYNIYWEHYYDYLKCRHISKRTMERFDIGFCTSGVYGGRVVVPVRMLDDISRGFVARAIDDEPELEDEVTKYLYPKGMEVTKCIFNYDNLKKNKPIIVVEGVFDAMHVWQFKNLMFKNVCSILGSRISSYQLDRLASLKPDVVYWLLDGDVRPGDKEGKYRANQKMLELAFDNVAYIVLDKGTDPTDYTESQLIERLDSPWSSPNTPLSNLKDKLNK